MLRQDKRRARNVGLLVATAMLWVGVSGFVRPPAQYPAPVPSRAGAIDCGPVENWMYHGFYWDTAYHDGGGYPSPESEDPDDPGYYGSWEAGDYFTNRGNFHDSMVQGYQAWDGHYQC